MLKKLRIKFICINMLIVTVMLGIIFGMVLRSTYVSRREESIRMLQMTLDNKKRGLLTALEFPCFIVDVSPDGSLANLSGRIQNTAEAREYAEKVLASAQQKEEDSAILSDYSLRYLRKNTPDGLRYAFIDSSIENLGLRSLIINSALIGTGSLVAFFFISLFLARWAVKPVEQAWKRQKEFIADASHELKTPLTVIMTNAELLESGEYPVEEQHRISSGILAMSAQMRGLVERLLELARVDNGAVQTEFVVLDFSELTEDAALPFEPLFFEKGLTLNTEIAPAVHVSGSASHLKQVVEILLDNAQKYSTDHAETFVSLRLAAHSRCLLEVRNGGAELGREDLKKIFQRFYRVDKARSMNHSYGLGLSIAKSIVEEHHGRIWAESRNGQNSFFVELPLA